MEAYLVPVNEGKEQPMGKPIPEPPEPDEGQDEEATDGA
jgi:hypothetical protein